MTASNISKMATWVAIATVTLCLILTTLAESRTKEEWNTWPKIRLPKMRVKSVQTHLNDRLEDPIEENAMGSNPDHRHGNGINTLDDLRHGNFDTDTIERSLSFQQAKAKDLRRVKRTQITVEDAESWKNLTLVPDAFSEDHDKIKLRKRRHVFGDDTRFRIETEEHQQMFPFSAVVLLSTGCSGILIGPKHVLTAAECIHNGRRYLPGAKKMKVGLIKLQNRTSLANNASLNEVPVKDDTDGMQWFKVDEFYLPDGWVSPSYGNKRDSFNYAVLELVEKHNHSCMEVGVSSILNTERMQRIHFSSFDEYKHVPKPVLTYRFCYIVSDTLNFLYEKCDSTKPSVGAGIYLRLWDADKWQWCRRVMAIKTSKNERIKSKGKKIRASRDVRITLLNFGQICYWVMRDFEACSRGRIKDACVEI